MYKYLEKIDSPKALKHMSLSELDVLCDEIRDFLLSSLSKTGGHLSSNLGVVELTLGLHKVFDCPNDKIIWDVGHQSYVHKIITNRKEGFKNLRQFKGLSGFPKEEESIYDSFNTGHSSTSISVGLGLACARDISKKEQNIISVIGDGAFTGGMVYEALNNLGEIGCDMTVILNDNTMSIDENTGGLAKFFDKDNICKENNYKSFVNAMGIKYYGPIDGHNIEELVATLEESKSYKGPKLVHILTIKGKGYKFSQQRPDVYHGVGKFNLQEEIDLTNDKSVSAAVGNKLVDMAKKDDSIVAVTAAMPSSTGLGDFRNLYKNRFFDVGICEAHAVTFCAALAKTKLKPYFVVYSSFLQRGFDQIIHDVCITNKNVKFLIDRSGVVGNDGETHHGVFDLSYLNLIPNIVVMSPKDTKELEDMMELANEIDGPVAIRYSKGKVYYLNDEKNSQENKISLGNFEVLKQGKDVAILAIGNMVLNALKASDILQEEGINPTIVNARFLKPLDENLLNELFKTHSTIITIEDNVITGGFSSNINTFAVKNNYHNKIESIAIDDCFIEQGNIDELHNMLEMSPSSIANKIKNLLDK